MIEHGKSFRSMVLLYKAQNRKTFICLDRQAQARKSRNQM